MYVFGKSLHQPEYQILKKGFEEGLSKRQISNVFIQQDILVKVNLPPLEAIEEYNGVKEGGVIANVYNDCSNIPDTSSLNVAEKICSF